MKRFISTDFILLIQNITSDIEVHELKKVYDEFAIFLFSENTDSTDKAAYHNALVYTRAELVSLTKVSGKKCSNLFK